MEARVGANPGNRVVRGKRRTEAVSVVIRALQPREDVVPTVKSGVHPRDKDRGEMTTAPTKQELLKYPLGLFSTTEQGKRPPGNR